MTEPLFRTDAYLRDCSAKVVAINDRGGIVLDRTVFYPSAGGQPGDRGVLEVDGPRRIDITSTVYDADKTTIVHVPAASAALPVPGQSLRAVLDWDTRWRHMRMHTALHLLCSLVRFPVTGGQVGAQEGRLDFDITDAGAVDKDELTKALNDLVAADHPVTERWITEEELDANPQLVRTMAVKPPRGPGKVRLVLIGQDGEVDLQPCGGTHVRSTGEIGPLAVTKIEKKGRLNRRIRVTFA
jgi:misacylated tRNA(Ala) deacylase